MEAVMAGGPRARCRHHGTAPAARPHYYWSLPGLRRPCRRGLVAIPMVI